MVNLLVYPNMCDTTYGTPDSEVMLTTFMICISRLAREDRQEDARVEKRKNRRCVECLKVAGWALVFLFWVSVLLQGFINGTSSVDQTTFGLMIGVLLAMFCNGVMYKPIQKHVTQLMNGEYTVKGYQKLTRNLVIASLGYLLVVMLLFMLFDQNI